jgi:hypothetical protein
MRTCQGCGVVAGRGDLANAWGVPLGVVCQGVSPWFQKFDSPERGIEWLTLLQPRCCCAETGAKVNNVFFRLSGRLTGQEGFLTLLKSLDASEDLEPSNVPATTTILLRILDVSVVAGADRSLSQSPRRPAVFQ